MIRLPALALPIALVLAAAGSGPARSESHTAGAATPRAHVMVHPNDLKWGPCAPSLPAGAQCAAVDGDSSAPGLFSFRAKLPDGWRIPAHTHAADEHVTVISGTFAMGMGRAFDAKALHAMDAGSYMMMPVGSAHFAEARGETVIQLHAIGPWSITYVNPADDPRSAKP
jgi:hypothetical protein